MERYRKPCNVKKNGKLELAWSKWVYIASEFLRKCLYTYVLLKLLVPLVKYLLLPVHTLAPVDRQTDRYKTTAVTLWHMRDED